MKFKDMSTRKLIKLATDLHVVVIQKQIYNNDDMYNYDRAIRELRRRGKEPKSRITF